MPVNLTATQLHKIPQQITATQLMRSNGLGFEARLSAAPALGAITMDFATMIVYGR